MTAKARQVLEDAEAALQTMHDCEYGPEWRWRWAAVVSLLRAVGHVLDKVDAGSNSALRQVVDERWAALTETRPEPAIFWQFVEDERNSVLKEYRFRGQHASGHAVTSIWTYLPDGTKVEQSAEELTDIHLHVFDTGPYRGRNQLEVAAEAVLWWTSYLEGIDAKAAAAGRAGGRTGTAAANKGIG